MIQFECPACGKQLIVKNSREDSIVKCPGCKERFELEISEEEDEGAAETGPDAVEDYDVVDEEAHAASTAPEAKPKDSDAPARTAKAKKKKKKKGKKKKTHGAVGLSRSASLTLLLILFGALAAGSYFIFNQWFQPEPAKVYTAIEARQQVIKWGGYVETDPALPGIEVIRVSFMGQSGSFKNEYLEPLVAFKKLRELNLANTRTTDLTADRLKGLTNLEVLNLSSTNITDAGLKELKTLVNLKELHLNNTLITDNGLAALSGLKNLKRLALTGTTAHGLELQSAIPGLRIEKN
ncbi:MAG: leucine-rich repeat domain-containing protein [Gemmataceae bacterium]